MAFIDGDVQRCLAAFITSIEIGSALRQYFHYGWLIAESSVMNGTVSIFILNNEKEKKNSLIVCFLRKPCHQVKLAIEQQ
jgi:hypothetical protein